MLQSSPLSGFMSMVTFFLVNPCPHKILLLVSGRAIVVVKEWVEGVEPAKRSKVRLGSEEGHQ